MGFDFKTKNLQPNVKAIINNKKENENLLKQIDSNDTRKPIYEIAIFIRLGNDLSTEDSGTITLERYENFCKENKHVWFSTDSLAYGMAKEKQKDFRKCILEGIIIEVYFVIGKKGGGDNQISYRGEVLDIRVDPDGMTSPDENLTPGIYINDKRKIWLKIEKLEKQNKYSTNDFIVASTKNILSDAIENSQYHFGYIRKIKNSK